MRAVDGLDLPQDKDTDTFSAWLQHAASRAPDTAGDARGVLANAAGSLANAFNAAIQVWQDFDDTAPLRPTGGTGECIDDWLGPVRRERLRDISRRVQAAAAQMHACLGNPPLDVGDAVGFESAQAALRVGASPPDAARAAISRLSARLVQARTVANEIKDVPTLT